MPPQRDDSCGNHRPAAAADPSLYIGLILTRIDAAGGEGNANLNARRRGSLLNSHHAARTIISASDALPMPC